MSNCLKMLDKMADALTDACSEIRFQCEMGDEADKESGYSRIEKINKVLNEYYFFRKELVKNQKSGDQS